MSEIQPDVLVGGSNSGTRDGTPVGCWSRPSQCAIEHLKVLPFTLQHSQGMLQGCVYLAPGGEPRPAVLVNCGCYSSLSSTMKREAPFYATRGYAYVLVWNTGTREQIADNVFSRWHEDAEATLNWLGEQPWCDGRIGAHGVSLMGSCAFAAAQASLLQTNTGPKVCALAPVISFSRIQPTVYLGGHGLAVELVLRFLWLAEVGVRDGEDALTGMAHARAMFCFFALQDFPGLSEAASARPIYRADEALWGRTNFMWRHGMDSRIASDPFWSCGRDQHIDFHMLGERCPPVLFTTGWWDIFLLQTLEDFTIAQQTRGDKRGVRLVVYAGGHFGVATRREIVQDTLAWYDEHILGLPVTQIRHAPVCLEVFGGDQGEFFECSSWPPTAEPLHMFFRVCCSGDEPTRLGDLVYELSHEDQPGNLQYVYDPQDPTPYVGGGWLSYRKDGPRKQRSLERRSDVLVVTSEAVLEGFNIIGLVRATLFIRCSAPECDVVVRLCVVRAPGWGDYFDMVGPATGLGFGTSMNLCEGLARVAFKPEGIMRIQVNVGPTCCSIREGDKIRLHICSAAHPKYLRHPLQPEGDDWLGGSCSLGPPAVLDIFSGNEWPSSIELPIVRRRNG